MVDIDSQDLEVKLFEKLLCSVERAAQRVSFPSLMVSLPLKCDCQVLFIVCVCVKGECIKTLICK